jgi:xylulose-5-phosphate/fructose-6-phosphate phosphoketolase
MEAALGTEHGTEHRQAQHRRDKVISAVIPGRPQEKRLDDEESGEKTGAPASSGSERILVDAYWRAANYLSVGQIYLYDNPLLKQSLTKDHIKPRLLGHWGTTPGLNSTE